jgi:hypothetical protein
MVRRMRLLLRKHWLFFRVVEHVWIEVLVWRISLSFFFSFLFVTCRVDRTLLFSYVFWIFGGRFVMDEHVQRKTNLIPARLRTVVLMCLHNDTQ